MIKLFNVLYRVTVALSLLTVAVTIAYGYFVPSAVSQWLYEVDHAYWEIYDQNCVVNDTACMGD